jgi:hypothetical protein
VFRPRRRALAGALCVAAAAAAATAAPAAAQPATACPSTFQVLHNDRIGSVELPKGRYKLRVAGVSCARASSLFAVFLTDYDGKLPSGWTATSSGRGKARFARAGKAFSVRFQRSGGGSGGLVCATPYRVTAPTQAGLLALPAGSYRLTRLSSVAPTCTQAAELLTSFLGLNQQVLPDGWISLPIDGSFVQDSSSYGFRIQPLP